MALDKTKVVYQIYPKSYKDTTGNGIGDFRGIIEKIPYLAELGVDMVWLNPFYPSPQRDNGYDISDYTAVNPVFSSGVMGQGIVIEPSQGELVSPVNGTVTVLFPTKHAVGIVSEEGVEMLMHIGMDTVSLDGKGFEAHVEQGDKVVVGQQLISFDMDVIKKAGLVTETLVIITNQDDFQADVEGDLPRDIKRGDALMIAH